MKTRQLIARLFVTQTARASESNEWLAGAIWGEEISWRSWWLVVETRGYQGREKREMMEWAVRMASRALLMMPEA
jgi:hypothetical protein